MTNPYQLISDDDLLGMYETLGNGATALMNGSLSVTGIFSNKFLMIDEDGLMVESAIPNFACRTSDLEDSVGNPLIKNGDPVVINNITYYVETNEPDGEGGSLIILHL